jgi:hypothetical protein
MEQAEVAAGMLLFGAAGYGFLARDDAERHCRYVESLAKKKDK